MKILLVDDDPVSCAEFRRIFDFSIGLEIIEVQSGRQAFELLCAGLNPELCVLDLQMPRMSGIELLQRIRSDPYTQHQKVVVISSTRDRESILQLAKLQISGYLLKPFDPVKINATFKPLLSVNKILDLTRRSSKFCVLSVEDDSVTRTAISAAVSENKNWEVKFAIDGQDAFGLLYAGLRPHLIITDLNMPNLNGVDFIEKVRKDRNFGDVKVAVMTADNDTERLKKLSTLNITACLRKPVDSNQINHVMNSVSAEWL